MRRVDPKTIGQPLIWRFISVLFFERRRLRRVNRNHDGKLLRIPHRASIHAIAIRYRHAARRMNSAVSIRKMLYLRLAPSKIRCYRDSNLADIECGISGILDNDEHAA